MRGWQIDKDFILIEYNLNTTEHKCLSNAVIHKLPFPNPAGFIKGVGITGEGSDDKSAWLDAINKAKDYVSKGKWPN